MSRVEWDVARVLSAERDAADKAVKVGAEHILGEAVDRAPIDRGDLRNSGTVATEDAHAVVSFDTPYAVRQHEEMNYHHDTGQAKYLESAAEDSLDVVRELMAAEIRRAFR